MIFIGIYNGFATVLQAGGGSQEASGFGVAELGCLGGNGSCADVGS